MTTTLTSSIAAARLRQAVLWRRAALERLSACRPALAEALIGMPASVERLSVERALIDLDRSITQTRQGAAEAAASSPRWRRHREHLLASRARAPT
jgi:hypothetical protein